MLLIVQYNHHKLLLTPGKQACGGALLFGMDMGIIGGVLTMGPFKE
jgi:hypothetical protein